jgi:hypothetical protein
MAGCNGMLETDYKAASYIGDSHSVSLDEVVVSVPVSDKSGQYQNLHVFFSAIINTDKQPWQQYEVEDIIRRSETRLSSLIVEELSELGVVSIKDLSSIRRQLVSRAQETFDSVFSEWSRSDEFKVEFVITSLFLTDTSVGRTRFERERFW